jgi:hypothetical protein
MRNALLDLRWRAYARHLAASKKPIIVGPYASEVGFEVLYWLPFLACLRERYHVSRDRLIVVGRGGSSAWYDAGGTADIFEFLPVETVRTLMIQRSQQTGSVKQHADDGWERHVCALAAQSVGISDYHVLSPKWMYRLLTPFWTGHQAESWLDRYLMQPIKLKAPKLPEGLKLPADFVAMRWYARPTWPHAEKLNLWTRKLVERVAKRKPVILINSGFQADDHADISMGDVPNVTPLSHLHPMAPLNGLAIQSAVIARASQYVGTYGGMAQGAMRWGVPTVALYDTFNNTAPAHLHYTQSLSLRTGVSFVAGTPSQIDDLGLLA